MPSRFPPESFDREDESPDSEFYAEPRLVTHIDEYAIAAVAEAYRRFLPPDGEYLDIMSSWVSHYPDDLPVRRVVGLGLNGFELSQNPLLADYTVQDLNENPTLPYEDGRFNGATMCVSVQYLTHPTEVFAEIGRVLKPGAPLIVTFSNRCFPMKAVRMWVNASSRQRSRIVATYMEDSGRFDVPEVYDMSPALYYYGVPEDPELRKQISIGEVQVDPLHAVVGRTRLFFL